MDKPKKLTLCYPRSSGHRMGSTGIGIALPFLLLFTLLHTSSSTLQTDCPTHCGNLSIPFPFGTRPGCYHGNFLLTCNDTFSPPRTFLNKGNVQVASLNPFNSTATVYSSVARVCNLPNSTAYMKASALLNVTDPYAISNNSNKFIALGCNTLAYYKLYSRRGSEFYYPTGCASMCSELSYIRNGTCSGIGCCQTAIPIGLQAFVVTVQTVFFFKNTSKLSPCSYAFLIDEHQYEFTLSDLTNFREKKKVPVVLDWAVGRNESCESAANTTRYLCGENTYCRNSANPAGYRCICKDGYKGNPYSRNSNYDPIGCKDIDECQDPANICSDKCENKPGSYACFCPHGYKGDGNKSGSGCKKHSVKLPFINTVVGCGLGLLFLILGFFIFYNFRKKRRMFHLREKFFKQNGGLLLEQKLSAREGVADTARIFTTEELKLATDNYADNRVLGHGGNGTVYKGILPDKGQVVAIKKSHYVDATQIEQFINEVVLLSQVVHKNVVRLLGCCLETQVPLLVYEYVPNGTLDHHLHTRPGSLDWGQRLRIAGETAEALAYLHSAIARPIFHRDVKAANILLDHNYMAKMSDFGASRLIPLDRTEVTTLVMGTLGYLDPEYFYTGQLTEKSDVYSFGVVLAELLTGQKPISGERQQHENLAIYFIVKVIEGELHEIVEKRVKNEGSREQIEAIAELAKRCLRMKGDERPTMREVAAEIERVRKLENDASQRAEEEEDWSASMEDLFESTSWFDSSTIGSKTEAEAGTR